MSNVKTHTLISRHHDGTPPAILTMRLPFDAHNHVHLGPTQPLAALCTSESSILSGMALMSTHPRDYKRVTGLVETLSQQVPGVRIVPCFGVHPWFLHELDKADWEMSNGLCKWVRELDEIIEATPNAMVGEIGLDGARYLPETGDLATPIDRQVIAFEAQMKIAIRRKRPVSVHSVQCWGPLMTCLSRLKKSTGLPPRMYFHAFGGKIGTVDQLLALCGRDSTYFGFAPVINFRSPKTASVIRHIGLDRLVLETDHEDAARVKESIDLGIQFLAQALDETPETIVERTTSNALALYRQTV